jgi:rhodanese-related sulfurtransferase
VPAHQGDRLFTQAQEAAMTTADTGVPEVGPGEGRALVDSGAVLLDVREVDEWRAGHASDAELIPLGELEARTGELARDRRIVAICRVGGRSERATRFLRAQGFDVVNLTGGMRAWATAGLEVVTDDGSPGTVI